MNDKSSGKQSANCGDPRRDCHWLCLLNKAKSTETAALIHRNKSEFANSLILILQNNC